MVRIQVTCKMEHLHDRQQYNLQHSKQLLVATTRTACKRLSTGGEKKNHNPIHLALMQDCHLEDFRREARSHQLISLKCNYFLHEEDAFPLFLPNSRWLLISFVIRKVKTCVPASVCSTLLNFPKRSEKSSKLIFSSVLLIISWPLMVYIISRNLDCN